MSAGITEKIELVEVGPRDGLQNEALVLTTDDKVALIHRLVRAGLRRIEVASFVNPARVPQMADAEAVVAALGECPDVTLIGLVLNEKGALRALQTSIHQLGAVAVASDAFGIRNQRQTIEDSIESATAIIRLARANGRSAQVGIAMSFGCPFTGEVAPTAVIEIARRLAESQPVEIALADTIGVAVPSQVGELVERVRDAIAPIPVRVHFHNTRNTAIANVWAAVMAGARTIDCSIGGLGGCPFAPNATGNVATEDVVYLLNRSGIETGVDLPVLIEDTRWLTGLLARELPAMVSRAGGFPVASRAHAR